MYIGVGYSITIANTDRDTRGHIQTVGKSWLRGYEKMIFRGTYIVRQWNNLCEHESDFRNLRRFKKYKTSTHLSEYFPQNQHIMLYELICLHAFF